MSNTHTIANSGASSIAQALPDRATNVGKDRADAQAFAGQAGLQEFDALVAQLIQPAKKAVQRAEADSQARVAASRAVSKRQRGSSLNDPSNAAQPMLGLNLTTIVADQTQINIASQNAKQLATRGETSELAMPGEAKVKTAGRESSVSLTSGQSAMPAPREVATTTATNTTSYIQSSFAASASARQPAKNAGSQRR
jgi:hypothetical protein